MNEYFEPLKDDELRDHLRLTEPPTAARSGWELDSKAILAAIDYLGIELPVRIRFMTSKYGERLGTHYSRTTNGKSWHRITIAQNIKQAGRASQTLWHELVHCMQAERFAKRTGQSINMFHEHEYKKSKGEWGKSYEGNLMEIEANKITLERNTNHLLCR